MPQPNSRLDALLRAGDPARALLSQPVSPEEQAALRAQLTPSVAAPPVRWRIGLSAGLALASVALVLLWRSAPEPHRPVPIVLMPSSSPPPLVPESAPPVATPRPVPPASPPTVAKGLRPRSEQAVPLARRPRPSRPPDPVETQIVIAADSTCTTQPTPAPTITITGDATGVVTTSPSAQEVSL